MNASCGGERVAGCGERASCEVGRPETCGPVGVRGQETRAQTREAAADERVEAALSPPSGRDIELFRAVKFELTSTRAAAERFKISQTRVRQIVARVGKWVAASVPAQDEAGEEKDMRLARLVAIERLQAMLEYLMIHWRINYEPKYQRQIQRVIAAQARLGAVNGQFDELVADAVGDLPHDGPVETWPVEPPEENPPVGDCSPVADAHTLDTLRAVSPVAANRYEDMVSGYAQALMELAELRETGGAQDLLSPPTFENMAPPIAVDSAVMSGQPPPALAPAMST
jgi:hypothetical protein